MAACSIGSGDMGTCSVPSLVSEMAGYATPIELAVTCSMKGSLCNKYPSKAGVTGACGRRTANPVDAMRSGHFSPR